MGDLGHADVRRVAHPEVDVVVGHSVGRALPRRQHLAHRRALVPDPIGPAKVERRTRRLRRRPERPRQVKPARGRASMIERLRNDPTRRAPPFQGGKDPPNPRHVLIFRFGDSRTRGPPSDAGGPWVSGAAQRSADASRSAAFGLAVPPRAHSTSRTCCRSGSWRHLCVQPVLAAGALADTSELSPRRPLRPPALRSLVGPVAPGPARASRARRRTPAGRWPERCSPRPRRWPARAAPSR